METHECLLRTTRLSASAPRIPSVEHPLTSTQRVLTRRDATAHARPARPYPKGRDHLRSRSRRSDPSPFGLPDGGRLPRSWAVASLRVRTRWVDVGGRVPSGKDALGRREWMLVGGADRTSLDGGSNRSTSLGFGRWPSPQAITSGRPGLVRGFRTDTPSPFLHGTRLVSLGKKIPCSQAPDPVRGACLLLPGVRANARTPATHTSLNHSPEPSVWSARSPIV